MGAYDSSNGKYTTPFSEKLLVDAFQKAGKRLDMGSAVSTSRRSMISSSRRSQR
jgi:hypothetical protein